MAMEQDDQLGINLLEELRLVAEDKINKQKKFEEEVRRVEEDIQNKFEKFKEETTKLKVSIRGINECIQGLCETFFQDNVVQLPGPQIQSTPSVLLPTQPVEQEKVVKAEIFSNKTAQKIGEAQDIPPVNSNYHRQAIKLEVMDDDSYGLPSNSRQCQPPTQLVNMEKVVKGTVPPKKEADVNREAEEHAESSDFTGKSNDPSRAIKIENVDNDEWPSPWICVNGVYMYNYLSESIFDCAFCGVIFPNRSSLIDHLEFSHNIDRHGRGLIKPTVKVKRQRRCARWTKKPKPKRL